MVEQKVTVINPTGLHLRPASELSKAAGKLESAVTLRCGDKTANAKSSLNIMALMVGKGTEITVVCEGESEQEDLAAIVAFIESGLGEL